MHDQFLPALLFDHHVESRWRFTFQDTLLRMASACLFIPEGDGLDASYEVGERRVHQQITERVTVSGCYKLYCSAGYLHTARPAYTGMRNITITRDFV